MINHISAGQIVVSWDIAIEPNCRNKDGHSSSARDTHTGVLFQNTVPNYELKTVFLHEIFFEKKNSIMYNLAKAMLV